METINERVFRLLGNEHGIQKRLSDFIGASESKVNKWKVRGSAIDSEFIPKIADFLGVSDAYLLRGKEAQEKIELSLSIEEEKLITGYRSLPPNIQAFVLQSISLEGAITNVHRDMDRRKNVGEYVGKDRRTQAPSTQSGLAK